MVGIELTFTKKVASGTDDLNNPTYTTEDIVVPDCLIAPVTEPTSIREQQALEQARDQVRIHLPKVFTGDVGGSTLMYDSKTFSLDADTVKFMDGNTPTRWNRYIRAERIDV